MKLPDLSREPLTPEEKYILTGALSGKSHPITAGVLGASLVEHELESALRKRISRKDDPTWKVLTSDVGPLSTFHRKIEMAYAMKIINEKFRDDLHLVRNIRNAFAHARRMIDFNHPLVVKELKDSKLLPKRQIRLISGEGAQSTNQSVYLIICLRITNALMKKQTRRKKVSALFRLMAGVPMTGTGTPGLTSKQIADALSAGPTQTAPLGPPGGLFGLEPILPRKDR